MGLFDWLNAPVDMSDASAGINNFGLIGATLRDVGSSLNGQEASALDSFYTRAQKANGWAQPSPGGDVRASGLNNFGLIGAALRDVGSSLNGQKPSALDSFYTRAQKANGWTQPSPGSDVRASGLNNFGLIGAALRDVGASLNGSEPSALDAFYTHAQRMNAQRRNAVGRATDASYRPYYPTYG